MTIRIPSGIIKRGIKTPYSKNYGRASKFLSAQKELDHIVSTANQQYVEALSVDGIDINYWHRCTEGRYCSCQNPNAVNVDVPTNGISAEEFNNAGEKASAGTKVTFSIRDARARYENTPAKDITSLGVNINDTSQSFNPNHIIEYDESDEEMEANAELEALQTMNPDSAILFGAEQVRCGICFRTGYVNGYNLLNGKRDILDATFSGFTLHGVMLNKENKPNTFDSAKAKSSYVEFTYEIPKYFVQCHLVSVRNNTINAQFDVVVREYNTNGAFVPLTTAFVNANKGETVSIRVRPKTDNIQGMVSFTHLELVYQFSPWMKAQMSPISEATNFAIFNSIINTDMTLPPTIAQASKEDVIWESKYGRLWKVTDVTDFMTANNKVCGWTTTIRLIQDYEQLALLRLIKNQNFALSFGQLEPFQGLSIR